MDRILVCVDLKKLSRKVLEKAIQLSKKLQAEISLLHVRDAAPTSSHSTPNHSDHSAKELIRENNEIQKLEELLRDSGCSYKIKQPTGDVIKEIRKEIEELDPLFLVLGSENNSALHHVVSGSIAGTILDKVGTSVLLVPEK